MPWRSYSPFLYRMRHAAPAQSPGKNLSGAQRRVRALLDTHFDPRANQLGTRTFNILFSTSWRLIGILRASFAYLLPPTADGGCTTSSPGCLLAIHLPRPVSTPVTGPHDPVPRELPCKLVWIHVKGPTPLAWGTRGTSRLCSSN